MDENIVLTTKSYSLVMCVFLCVKNEIVQTIARQIKYNCLVISRSLRSSETLLVNKQSTVFFALCATRTLRRTFLTISQTFHEPEEMPVVCRSSAQPQLPWQHFLEFLKLPGLKQPNSLLQKYLNMSSHGKCGLVASSPPAIPGLSEGVKDHFFGFDKDFGGPPASQE